MVRKYCELYGCRICVTRGEQEKAYLREPSTSLGWSIPVQVMHRWSAETMCTRSRSHTNHREMPYCSIWRPLRSIQESSKNLAKWFLLANNVWRHQRIHPKVLKMPDAGWHNNSQCNAPHKQSPSRTIRHLGRRLHGTIPEVLGLRVHIVAVEYVSK